MELCLGGLWCQPYCCAGGVGWAAALPLWSQCFSYTGWLADVRWIQHPVTRCSHCGCVCSLYGSALWLPGPLGLCWLFCHPHLQFSASVGDVLCSPFGFPCLRVPALLACGVCGVSYLRSWCSLGCPSWLVLLLMSLFILHLLLRVWLFGHSLLAPPAAPVC